jgi:hypothetical protein
MELLNNPQEESGRQIVTRIMSNFLSHLSVSTIVEPGMRDYDTENMAYRLFFEIFDIKPTDWEKFSNTIELPHDFEAEIKELGGFTEIVRSHCNIRLHELREEYDNSPPDDVYLLANPYEGKTGYERMLAKLDTAEKQNAEQSS